MILLDEPETTTKSATIPRPLDQEPPAPPPYSPTEADPLLPQGPEAPKYLSNRWWWPWAISAYALVICLTVFYLVLGAKPRSPHADPVTAIPGEVCVSAPQWGNVVKNSQETDGMAAIATLFLPHDIPTLTITTSSNPTFGSVHICSDPNWKYPFAGVQVIAESRFWRTLELVSVCRKIAKGGQSFVQIVTSPSDGSSEDLDPVEIVIIVVLPTAPGASLHYPYVHVNTPQLEAVVTSLSGNLRLGHVILNTTKQVTVDRLAADTIEVSTQNASINGIFDVVSSLALSTNGGTMDIFADMTSSLNATTPTRMSLTSTNGNIVGNIRLHSSSWHGQGGSFNVTASALGTPVSLRVSAGPAESRLFMDINATHAPAILTLHPTYEGIFSLLDAERSDLFVTDPHDPTGAGRRRHVASETSKEGVRGGWVWWDEAAPTVAGTTAKNPDTMNNAYPDHSEAEAMKAERPNVGRLKRQGRITIQSDARSTLVL